MHEMEKYVGKAFYANNLLYKIQSFSEQYKQFKVYLCHKNSGKTYWRYPNGFMVDIDWVLECEKSFTFFTPIPEDVKKEVEKLFI